MVSGIFYILGGLSGFMPNPLLGGAVVWEKGIIDSLYGIFATTASGLFDPCRCGCCAGNHALRKTVIPGLSLIATLMALASLIKMGVDFGQYNASVSAKDTFAKTVCCPSTATSYSEVCSPSEDKKRWPGDSWVERMLCSDDYVAIETTPEGQTRWRSYRCCPAGASGLTDDCDDSLGHYKCASYGKNCLAGPQIKCPDGYKPMGTGDLGAFKDTPDGKKEVGYL